MKCFECHQGKLTNGIADLAGEVRGQRFKVRSEAMTCNRCGAHVLNDEQSAAYTVAISDAYRVKHGMLTSSDLRDARARLGLSHAAFARFLEVGVASVKRWEAGLIQDEANDRLIRLRTDLEAARHNVRALEQRLDRPSGKVSAGRPSRGTARPA
jgi:putative zinc finger/helix-turn-helix YgiT family protein